MRNTTSRCQTYQSTWNGVVRLEFARDEGLEGIEVLLIRQSHCRSWGACEPFPHGGSNVVIFQLFLNSLTNKAQQLIHKLPLSLHIHLFSSTASSDTDADTPTNTSTTAKHIGPICSVLVSGRHRSGTALRNTPVPSGCTRDLTPKGTLVWMVIAISLWMELVHHTLSYYQTLNSFSGGIARSANILVLDRTTRQLEVLGQRYWNMN